jgi:hypothetical protein
MLFAPIAKKCVKNGAFAFGAEQGLVKSTAQQLIVSDEHEGILKSCKFLSENNTLFIIMLN